MQNILKPKFDYYLIFGISILICISNIWGYEITILDEAKNAEAAREMFYNHHFLPTFNGFLRTDKPPLHYFFMQISYSVFGANHFSARLFSALFGAIFTILFYHYVKKFTHRSFSLMTTFLLLSSFFWVQEFHLAVPDPYFLFFLCISWLFFFDFFKFRKKCSLFLFYTFVGLATLSKGPIAIALSGLILFVFLIIQKEFTWKKIWKFQPLLGGLWVLAISVPWFLWIHFQTDGAFTTGFFIHHNVKRFGTAIGGHGGLFIKTWLFVLLGLFPFGTFIIQGLWHGVKFFKRNDFLAFSLTGSVVVITFFSFFSTKLPQYTLPAMPFLAVLISSFFEETHYYKVQKHWANKISLVLISLFSLAIPLAIYYLFHQFEIELYTTKLVIFLFILISSAIYFIWRNFLKESNQKWIYKVGILWIFLGLMIFYVIYPKLTSKTPVILAQSVIKNKNIVVYIDYDPAFNFNEQKTYKVFENKTELNQYIENNKETLILTKNRAISNDSLLLKNYQIIFNEPALFENYNTIILKKK